MPVPSNLFLGCVLGCVLALACEAPVASKQRETDDGSGSGDPDASAPSTPSSEGDASSGIAGDEAEDEDDQGTAGQEGSGGGSGGASGGGTGNADVVGQCVAACEADADCCPFGALGCPGPAYPNNWSCVDGACSFGGCTSDDDCDGLLGLGPEECHEVAGVPTCVAPCDGGGCGLGTQCVGEADDATTFCAAPQDGPCESDDDCNGAGTCALDTGLCGCSSDDDCSDSDTVCAIP